MEKNNYKNLLKERKNEDLKKISKYTNEEILEIFNKSRIYFDFLWKSVDIFDMTDNEKKLRYEFWKLFEENWIKFIDVIILYFYNKKHITEKYENLKIFEKFDNDFLLKIFEEFKNNIQLIEYKKNTYNQFSKKEKELINLITSIITKYWYWKFIYFLNLKLLKNYKNEINTI